MVLHAHSTRKASQKFLYIEILEALSFSKVFKGIGITLQGV